MELKYFDTVADCGYADDILERYDEICEGLKEKSMQYKVLATRNVDIALELLD